MAEILSLNRARKARARVANAAQAEANRAKFGRTRIEKDAEKIASERRAALLDGAKRED